MKKEIENFVEAYLRELKEDNAAILADAGLSLPAGFVDWRNFLCPLAEELDLDIDLETDLVAVAQFHINNNSMNRNELTRPY